MTVQDRHSDYVRQMLSAARQISEYAAGMSKENFLADTAMPRLGGGETSR